MNPLFIQPPQVAWASGALSAGPLLRKSTRIQDLAGVFADEHARQAMPGDLSVYDVEMLATSPAEGDLYVGVTHLYPGKIGHEFFMTRGHFHNRREQGEARLESVFAGSVHIIPGFTAHRLINTGDDVLSALAVWPTAAGHDYAALANGFAIRVVEESQTVQVKEVPHG